MCGCLYGKETLVQTAESFRNDSQIAISSLEEGRVYKFLLGAGKCEARRQDCSSKCSKGLFANVFHNLVRSARAVFN